MIKLVVFGEDNFCCSLPLFGVPQHAGMNGQRVTNAIAKIHQKLGLSSNCSHKSYGCDETCPHLSEVQILAPFNCLNYSDDIAGVEPTFGRASLAFSVMGSLLEELGLSESLEKAVAPCKVLTYLGIEFSTSAMEMRIDENKCNELRIDIKNG